MYPPFTPIALPRVPTSTSARPPVTSSVPRPVVPNPPTPCESSTTSTQPRGKRGSYFRHSSAMRSTGAWSPRMLNTPSVITSALSACPSDSSSRCSRARRSRCPYTFRALRGELHAVDDAVVVQLVGDEHRLGRSQAEEHARDRRVSGAGQHACRAAMKVGQRLLEPDVRRVRAADEPHRSRTHAVPAGGVLLRLDQLAPQREPEIRVRVHPDELELAASLEDEAGAPAALRRFPAQHPGLLAIRDARSVDVRQRLPQ